MVHNSHLKPYNNPLLSNLKGRVYHTIEEVVIYTIRNTIFFVIDNPDPLSIIGNKDRVSYLLRAID